jgi:hypothetical protein
MSGCALRLLRAKLFSSRAPNLVERPQLARSRTMEELADFPGATGIAGGEKIPPIWKDELC